MATNTGARGAVAAPTEVVDGLNDLLQLNHDAIGAYDIAIERLKNRDHAMQIAGFRADHERHIRELTPVIAQLGGSPRNEPHATAPMKEAMQRLGAAAGDRGTLIAWRANELQVRVKYDSYAAAANSWPPEVKHLVDEQALDEERHYAWVAEALEDMGVGSGEGIETDLANLVRERMESLSARARVAAERMKARAGGAAMDARARAASGLERAADRLDAEAARREGAGGMQGRAASAAHRLADGLDQTADYVRASGADLLRHDLEEQVRTSPVRTVLVLFGVGFVIGRILR